MQKYGLGKQDFASLRDKGFVYVDKSAYIQKLLDGSGNYFLSRPRRFGKSLFLSMLESFFRGDRRLFEGLAIERITTDWNPRPVVRIDLSSGTFSEAEGLRTRLLTILDEIASSYGVNIDGPYPGDRFHSLIRALKNKYDRKVVILIDEYEKPLLNTLDEEHFERSMTELRDFYSILKGNEGNIELLFITGVTRFGHLNIFSGLNNLTDISLEDKYAAICGITQEELHDCFKPGIDRLASAIGLSVEETLLRMKQYYDGYHFSGALLDIYNPYSVLSCLEEARFTDKWFQTGSSSYLLDRLRKNRFDFRQLEGVTAIESTLLGVDASMRDSITLLYQSGYLTIKHYDPLSLVYTLGLPNQEVATSLYQAIIPYYSDEKIVPSDYAKIKKWVDSGDAEKVMSWLKQFFNRIPYEMKLMPKTDRFKQESDFQFVVFSILYLACGAGNVALEESTSHGRMDLVVSTEKYIYIFEFKLGDDSSKAIGQIEAGGYADKWASDDRKIIKIGVSFSPETRDIMDDTIR